MANEAPKMVITPAPEELTERRGGRSRTSKKDDASTADAPNNGVRTSEASPELGKRQRKRTAVKSYADSDDGDEEKVTLPVPGDGNGNSGSSSSRNKRRKSVQSTHSGSNAGDTGSISEAGTGAGQRELLSEEQKRANHIESEKKRRQNIRAGFEQLVDMVPELKEGMSKGMSMKNEALILQKCGLSVGTLCTLQNVSLTCSRKPTAYEYIEELKQSRQQIQARVMNFRSALGEQEDLSLMDDSEDEEVDEFGKPKQAPARLVQIQHLAKQALREDTLPSADVVFQLAAEGRLQSGTPTLD